MAATNTATSTAPARLIPDQPERGIRISITNQQGQRYRYRAQAVSLSMRKGVLQVVENAEGCFVWFDQCNLEVRDGVRNLLFHLKAGAASHLPGAELVILADLGVPATKAKTRRSRSFASGSATSLPS